MVYLWCNEYSNSNRVTSVLFEKDDPADTAKIQYKNNCEYATDRMIDNFH